jgi:hypothetical protein
VPGPSDIGRAGEHRVVAELLLRDFRPLLAIVDDGVDITLESGRTIQVKTSSKPRLQGKRPHYAFSFQSSEWRRGRAVKRRRMLADFAVCWCIQHDLFYVIPRMAVGSRTVLNLSVDPSRPSMFDRYRNAWEILR